MLVPTRPLAVVDTRDNVAVSPACRTGARAVTDDMADRKLLLAGPRPFAGAVRARRPGAVASLDLAFPLTAHGAAHDFALQAAAAAFGALLRLL